jgi:hypothetical protein
MTDFNVRLSSQNSFKVVSTIGGLQVPAKLQDLIDVGITETDKKDKYVVMYDSSTGLYKLVNPDEVLSAATSEPIQPGLPANFTNQLDIDLDNKIDVDAGEF